jgi:hypothetical protein
MSQALVGCIGCVIAVAEPRLLANAAPLSGNEAARHLKVKVKVKVKVNIMVEERT